MALLLNVDLWADSASHFAGRAQLAITGMSTSGASSDRTLMNSSREFDLIDHEQVGGSGFALTTDKRLAESLRQAAYP
jgi:hypothetical protein